MGYTIASREYVERYRLPADTAEAEAYLEHRRETIHLLRIYHQHFPNDFPQEWRSDQEKLLPVSANTYSESELSCLTLIDARLFPFALNHLLACREEGERLSTIPLWSFGIDHWQLPLADFSAGWQLLLLLFSDTQEREGRSLDPCVLDARQQMKKSVGGLSLPRLEELCRTAASPPTAIA